jgi:nucleoside-diphosphate-sugar epimerase
VNLGTGTGITVLQLASTLAALLGKPQLVRESPAAVHDPKDFVVADSSKLRGLGWSPRTELRDGLRQLIQSLA